MAKRVLMIAYHYPPCRGSSGSLRTLNFTRHLPKYGWEPMVLSAHPRAYPEVANDQLQDMPPSMPIRRAFAVDARRHLAICGRYASWSALPDRWISWLAGAVPAGLDLIRKYRPQVIWSTYPIATALWIGYALHRITKLPWVADLRDPLTEIDPRTGQPYPPDKRLWKARRAIESRAVEHSARTVLVTTGAKRIYAERYPYKQANHWAIIPNGYEEEIFASIEGQVQYVRKGSPFQLLHSGLLYPTPDRDPSFFLRALSNLTADGKISPSQLRVTFRASGYDDRYQALIRQMGLQDMVRLEPAIPYRDALKEMICADGLLLFQGYTSNPAVPAKLYEYLRARRPILAMADGEGDTAETLRAARVGTIVPLDSSEQIADGILNLLQQIQQSAPVSADDALIRSFARESRACELAELLDEVAA